MMTLQTVPELPPFHVVVSFGSGIPADAQGPVMLTMERTLREQTGLDVRVLKETMADDSKLRRSMTKEQRERL